MSVLLSLKKRPAIRYAAGSDACRELAKDMGFAIQEEAELFDFRQAHDVPPLLLVCALGWVDVVLALSPRLILARAFFSIATIALAEPSLHAFAIVFPTPPPFPPGSSSIAATTPSHPC